MPHIRSFRFSALPAAVLGAVLLLAGAVRSEPLSAGLVEQLRAGGHVIVFRHGATVAAAAKVDSMSRPNVPAQRQLNDEGRAQARAIGEALRKLKIPVAQVLTSTVQRAVDTGRLFGLGEVATTSDLAESGPESSAEDNERRAQALRRLVATAPPAGGNVVLVSHKPNLVDAFGAGWSDVREGEASVFQPDGKGGTRLVARVSATAWTELAAEAH
ncbi:histidine phosphatase family protein [Bradyrhizobium sp. USDA 4353]